MDSDITLTLRTLEACIPTAQTSLRRQKSVYRMHGSQRQAQKSVYHWHGMSTPGARSRYTDFFSNAYRHRNTRVIEIQTRQQLKNNFSHETQPILGTSIAFGHLAANIRVRLSDFSKLRVYAVYSNRHPPSLRALRNFAMADFEQNVEEIVGTTREAVDGDRVQQG